MSSNSFSAKSPSWFKTKVFSFVSLILISFLLIGCGSDGGSEGSKSSNKELTGFTFENGVVKSANISQSEQTVDIAIDYISTNDGYYTYEAPNVTIAGVSYSPNGTIDFNTSTPKIYTVTAEDSTTKDYNVTVRRAFVISDANGLANAINNITSDITALKPINYITIFVANDINLSVSDDIVIPSAWTDKNITFESNSTSTITIRNLTVQGSVELKRVSVVPPATPSSSKDIIGFTFDIGVTKSANISQSEQTVDIAIAYNSTIDGYSPVPPTVTITGESYSPNGTFINFSTAMPKIYTVTAEDSTTKDYNVTVRRAFVISDANGLANAINNIDNIIAANPLNPSLASYITIFVANDINLSVSDDIVIPSTWTDKNIRLENNNSGSSYVTIRNLTVQGNIELKRVSVVPPATLSSSKDITGFTFGSGDIKSANINQSAQTVDIAINYISTNNGYYTLQAPNVNHTGVSYSPNGAIDFTTATPKTYTVTAEDSTTKSYDVTLRRAFVVSNETGLANAINTVTSDIEAGKPINYITIFVANDINLTSNKTILSGWAGRNIILENSSNTPLVTITGLTIEGSDTVTLTGVKVVEGNITNPKSFDKELTGFSFSGGVIKPAVINGTTVDITISYNSVDLTPTVIHTGVSYSPAGAINLANLPLTYTITAEDGTTKSYDVTPRRAFIVSTETELANAIDTITSDITAGKPTTYITIFVANDITLASKKTILSVWAGRNIILEKYNSVPQDVTITGLTVEGSGTVGLSGVKVYEGNNGGLAQIGADCSGDNCGVNTRSYTGSGVGVWRYTNNAVNSTNLSISLSNVAGKEVTVVFTNEKNLSISFPPSGISGKFLPNEIPPQTTEPDISNFNNIPDHIRYFDKQEMLRQAAANSSQNFAVKPLERKDWQVGNQNNWYVMPKTTVETRTATLIKQTNSGNRTINFWVENGEFASGKVTQTMLDSISDKFTNNVYNNVVSIAGEPWGATGLVYSYSLIDATQPLDIVFVNFDKNNLAGGLVGYFWSLNNMRKNALYPQSNEALVFFADTETLYLYSNGVNIMLSTAAHELTHMISFYQRDVKMSSSDAYDTFLEEMTAIMMEDVIGNKIADGFNDVRDSNYRGWLSAALYNCDFTNWNNCNSQNVYSYHTAGSFGAYLLRHYGIGFYKSLLKYPVPRPLSINDRQNSIALLDSAIKEANGEGLARAVQRWGAGIALFPAASSPAGFGYPSRTELGFTLSAFDGDSFKSIRTLPTSQPSTLNGYGHYPLKRNITTYQYEETVAVPSGVSVTVIVK